MFFTRLYTKNPGKHVHFLENSLVEVVPVLYRSYGYLLNLLTGVFTAEGVEHALQVRDHNQRFCAYRV